MDINLEHKRIELIQWLTTIEDESIIKKLLKLRENEQSDWWNEISQAEKDSIHKGLDDANAGNLKSHSQAKDIYGKWL